MRRKLFILCGLSVCFSLFFCSPGHAVQTPVGCLTSTATLDDTGGKNGLVHCVRNFIQRKNTNVFQAPTLAEQRDFLNVTSAMLQGECGASLLPASMSFYTITTFTDNTNNQAYCVLLEKDTKRVNKKNVVTHGWGTLIVNNNAARELSIQIPHPWFDSNTPMQGAGVFKDVGARTFLMAGAHRGTNRSLGKCQGAMGYKEADVAHEVNTIYHAVAMLIDNFYATRSVKYSAIQFHGMSNYTCTADVLVSHGINQAPAPNDFISGLQEEMRVANPAWNVAVPGDVPCSVYGSSNVQGRVINGVDRAAVCTAEATGYTGRFVHIEQKKKFRLPNDWSAPIGKAWDIFLNSRPGNGSGSVEGQIFLQGRSDNSGARVRVYQGTTLVTEGFTDFTGNYILKVPAGNYEIYAEKNSYLYATKSNVSVSFGSPTYLAPVTLIGGDINGDGTLDVLDLYAVSDSFGTACPTIPVPEADWNGDCSVNTLDLCGVGENFGRSSPLVWQ